MYLLRTGFEMVGGGRMLIRSQDKKSFTTNLDLLVMEIAIYKSKVFQMPKDEEVEE